MPKAEKHQQDINLDELYTLQSDSQIIIEDGELATPLNSQVDVLEELVAEFHEKYPTLKVALSDKKAMQLLLAAEQHIQIIDARRALDNNVDRVLILLTVLMFFLASIYEISSDQESSEFVIALIACLVPLIAAFGFHFRKDNAETVYKRQVDGIDAKEFRDLSQEELTEQVLLAAILNMDIAIYDIDQQILSIMKALVENNEELLKEWHEKKAKQEEKKAEKEKSERLAKAREEARKSNIQ